MQNNERCNMVFRYAVSLLLVWASSAYAWANPLLNPTSSVRLSSNIEISGGKVYVVIIGKNVGSRSILLFKTPPGGLHSGRRELIVRDIYDESEYRGISALVVEYFRSEFEPIPAGESFLRRVRVDADYRLPDMSNVPITYCFILWNEKSSKGEEHCNSAGTIANPFFKKRWK